MEDLVADAIEIFRLLIGPAIVVWIIIKIYKSDPEIWDYEVSFPYKEGVGRGALEFECYKKKGEHIEARFKLEPEHQNHEIKIYLNGELVHTIHKAINCKNNFRIKEKIDVKIKQPSEDDTVTIRIGGLELFSGVLHKD